ncbi:MAG: hypothetical protein JNJ73_12120 [Hyphomonadaceae bacterium]|nr:hypothetical protein [Hyphomonadaceae bacterium]
MRNLVACGAGVAAVTAVAAPPDALANAQEEAQKQASRLISQAISDRIAARTDLSFDSSPGVGDRAAWGISSYSKLDSAQDAAAAASFDFGMDLGLLAGGYDWGVSDRIISGVNTSLYFFNGDAASDDGFGGTLNTELTGVGFTAAPYVAYQVNDYFFLSGVFGAGYSSTTVDIPSYTVSLGPPLGSFTSPAMSLTSGAATLNADLAANFVQSAGLVSFREKVLYRANYSIPDSGGESTLSSSFGVGAEAEMKVGANAGIYLNAESNYQIDDDATEDRYPIYVGAGINYRPSEYMQFGAGYQTEFGDDTTDISSILVTGRIKFRGGLRAQNNAPPVDNRIAPVDDYSPLYSPASAPAAPPAPAPAPTQYQQYQGFQPAQGAQQYQAAQQYQGAQYQGSPYQGAPAAAPTYQSAQAYMPAPGQQPAFQPVAAEARAYPAQTSAASSVCESRLAQQMQTRQQAGRASPEEDARTFRAIYDDYDRCMVAAR